MPIGRLVGLFLLRQRAFAGLLADDQAVIALAAITRIVALFLGHRLGRDQRNGGDCRAGSNQQFRQETATIAANLRQSFIQIVIFDSEFPPWIEPPNYARADTAQWPSTQPPESERSVVCADREAPKRQ